MKIVLIFEKNYRRTKMQTFAQQVTDILDKSNPNKDTVLIIYKISKEIEDLLKDNYFVEISPCSGNIIGMYIRGPDHQKRHLCIFKLSNGEFPITVESPVTVPVKQFFGTALNIDDLQEILIKAICEPPIGTFLWYLLSVETHRSLARECFD